MMSCRPEVNFFVGRIVSASEGDIGTIGDICRIASEIDPVIAGQGDKFSGIHVEYGEISAKQIPT